MMHTIELKSAKDAGRKLNGSGEVPTACYYDGKMVMMTTEPLYDCARWLLSEDLALPNDTIQTMREGTVCLTGPVGDMAKWTIT